MGVTIRQPGLLDSELQEIARLTPSAGTFSFKYNAVSEATLTVPEDGPAVGMHSWVALYGLRGFLGVYRVVNAAQTVGRQIQLSLLHGIDILSDSVWEPASAGASEETFSGNMTQYLTAILNHQTHLIQIGESDPVKPWVLGTCASSEVITDKKLGYNRLIDLLMDTVPEGGDYELVYDMTVFPWTVSMVAKSSAVAGEFRAAHNMSGVTITYNDADLCTRLALAVTSGGTSRVKIYNAGAIAQNTWGIVTKTASIDTNDTLSNPTWPEADAWAAGFFALHAQPSVQVQVEGEDLARQTGDTWDEAALGRMMRVPLPDYATTVTARAVQVDYPDPYGQPERVTVSLANTLPQFTEQIRIVEKTASSAYGRAGAAAAKAEEADEKADEVIYRTDFTKTDRGIGMLAQAIGVKIDPQTHLPVYDEVTGQYAFEGNNGATLSGRLSIEADKVITEVVTARSDFPELSSRLTQMADDIDARVKSVDLDTKVAAEGFIKLSAATGAAEAVVGASLLDNGTLSVAKIVTAVNGSTGQSIITLDADHIEMTSSKKLGGMVYVSGGDLYATGDIQAINGGGVYAEDGFHTSGDSSFEGDLVINSGDLDLVNGATLKVGGTAVDPVASIAANANPPSGQIGITVTPMFGSAYDVNFNIAATQTYIDGVAAAKSAALAGVTVSGWEPTNGANSAARNQVKDGDNNVLETINIPAQVTSGDGLYVSVGAFNSSNEATVTVYPKFSGVSCAPIATATVNDGTRISNATYAGKASVTLTAPSWNAISGEPSSSRTVTVSTSGRTDSSGTTDNLSESVPLFLTSSGLTVSMRTNSTSGTVYAKTTCSDANLTAGNIKDGVTIFGVTGTYAGASGYDEGWADAVDTISLTATTTSLNPGGSATVRAMAYASKADRDGGASKTQYDSKVISASSVSIGAGAVQSSSTAYSGGISKSLSGTYKYYRIPITVNGSTSTYIDINLLSM